MENRSVFAKIPQKKWVFGVGGRVPWCPRKINFVHQTSRPSSAVEAVEAMDTTLSSEDCTLISESRPPGPGAERTEPTALPY